MSPSCAIALAVRQTHRHHPPAGLAFRTDATRVCTLKLNNDHSSLRFPHLKVDYVIHHLLSHTDGADWLKVNQFFAQQVAYVAAKLDAV